MAFLAAAPEVIEAAPEIAAAGEEIGSEAGGLWSGIKGFFGGGGARAAAGKGVAQGMGIEAGKDEAEAILGPRSSGSGAPGGGSLNSDQFSGYTSSARGY